MAQAVEDRTPFVTRIGKYKASKVGNGFKISIPKEIKERWNLSGDEELILYAEIRGDEICVIVSRKPLPGDLLG